MSENTDSPYYGIAYNGTNANGGDSLTENLNLYYNAGDIAWVITSTALVLLMIPGVGYAHLNNNSTITR
jgi:Amt family ammonium transporter